MVKIFPIVFVLLLGANLQQITAQLDDSDETVVGRPDYRFQPFLVGEKAYTIIAFTKVDWFTAQQICSYNGMTLASINSAKESEDMQRILSERNLSSTYFWLSGTNLSEVNRWVWFSNGLTLNFPNWAPGHPISNNRCLLLRPGSKFESHPCNGQQYVICENRCPLTNMDLTRFRG